MTLVVFRGARPIKFETIAKESMVAIPCELLSRSVVSRTRHGLSPRASRQPLLNRIDIQFRIIVCPLWLPIASEQFAIYTSLDSTCNL